MRKSKFSESQIVGILKDAESGVPVADLLRKYGVSKATFFKWRSKYGGASISDVKRLRELETENAKLKRMYADLALENAAIVPAQRNLEVIRQAYQLGQMRLLDVLVEQRRVLDMQLSSVDIRQELHKSLFELERALGGPVQ